MADRAPTICKFCDNVVAETRKLRPTQWLCRAFPRRFAEGFVDPEWWIENEPFSRCETLNRGCCPAFTRRRDAQQENGL